MNNKEVIKYFYETVVSRSLIDEVSRYISSESVLRIGETVIPLGINGMTEHLIDVKKTYPDYSMRIVRQHCDGNYIISEFVMEGTHKGFNDGRRKSFFLPCSCFETVIGK